MKKIILSAAALFIFGFASAQDVVTTDASAFGFTDGDVFVEGNLSFSSSNDKNTDLKESNFSINPKVGYFISEDLAIGAEIAIGSGKSKVDGTTVDENSNFGGGVFARYYFLDLGQRFKTYGELGAGFVSAKDGLDAAEVKTSGFGIGVDLGINYFVNQNLAINFGLSNILSYNSAKVKDGEAVSEFQLNANVFNNFFATPTFGLTYKL